MADDLFEHLQALCGEDVETLAFVGCGGVGEPCVVFVGEGAGFEAGGVQGRGEGVVAGVVSVSYGMKTYACSLH